MSRDGVFSTSRAAGWRFWVIAPAVLFFAIASMAAERIHLTPKFETGDALYYQIEIHTVSTGKTTTPIVNPDEGTKFSQTVDLLVRLDVLPPVVTQKILSKAHANGGAPVQMRLTYERVHTDSNSDAPAFDARSAGSRHDSLAGRSFEFTLQPSGAITDIQGSGGESPEAGDAVLMLSWLNALVSSNEFPRQGISMGQHWSRSERLTSAPLAGLVWHTDSTYVRDEACRPVAVSAKTDRESSVKPAECAVILKRMTISRRRSDKTPPDYLRHGLRTTGTISGSGESLDSISVATGLLDSSTRSSTQRADFDIVSAANGEKIHRDGQVQTQTIIKRVDAPPPAP